MSTKPKVLFVSVYPSMGQGKTLRPSALVRSMIRYGLSFRVENANMAIPSIFSQLRAYYPDTRLVLLSPMTRLKRHPHELFEPIDADVGVQLDKLTIEQLEAAPAVVKDFGGAIAPGVVVFEPTAACASVLTTWNEIHGQMRANWNATLQMALHRTGSRWTELPQSTAIGNMTNYVFSDTALGPDGRPINLASRPVPFDTAQQVHRNEFVTPTEIPGMPIPTCPLPHEHEQSTAPAKYGSFSFFSKTRTIDLLNRAGWTPANKPQRLTDTQNTLHASQLARKLTEAGAELMVIDNFAVNPDCLSKLRATARNVVHVEDGWFDHGETVHCDPLGFCWDSSLSQLPFPGHVNAKHVRVSEDVLDYMARRNRDDEATSERLAAYGDYVLWPLQLIDDRVNLFGENATTWSTYVRHARSILPTSVKLLLKPHPRHELNSKTLAEMRKLADASDGAVVLLPHGMNLTSCIDESRGVIGMNSTVLYEARLLRGKPVWCYADSWYNGHGELFYRLTTESATLKHDDELLNGVPDDMDDYVRWFIYQLAVRQFPKNPPDSDLPRYIKHLRACSYQQWKLYGAEMFG